MSHLKTQIAQQLHECQGKYVYFLLGVAAAAIALSVQRTTGSPLTWRLMLLGLAVLSWAGSFFAGCRNRAHFSAGLYSNLAFLQLQDGSHPQLPSRPELVAAACEGVRQAAEQNFSSGSFWTNLQFRLLVLGAVLFLAWHVFEMASVKA